MVAFGAIVISILMAYRAMSVGLLTILSRCALGIVAIAIGAGLAGGLRAAIPAQGNWLQGGCFIVLSLGSYLLMRGLVMYYMLERDVPLPSLADRLGAGICGFFGGLMLCGYISMVLLVFPVQKFGTAFKEGLVYTAEYGIAPVHLVGTFAGTREETGLRICLDNIIYKTPPRAGQSAPTSPAEPKQPQTAPAKPNPQES